MTRNKKISEIDAWRPRFAASKMLAGVEFAFRTTAHWGKLDKELAWTMPLSGFSKIFIISVMEEMETDQIGRVRKPLQS